MNIINRELKRLGLIALGIASLAATGEAVKPRIVAWNEASRANTIANQRAASCIPVAFVKANLIPIDSASRLPLEPGTLVCDWQGRTAQINGFRAMDFVRQGQAKTINEVLMSRGFQPPTINGINQK